MRAAEVFSETGPANPGQRGYFAQLSRAVAERAEKTDKTALQVCLGAVWESYDLGGISHGRSLRSSLLEASQASFGRGDVPRGRECLARLVALYLEPKRQTDWYDGQPCEKFPFGALAPLSLLVRAAIEAGVQELPDVSDPDDGHILALTSK